jgi:O-antigen/teichoic acid export membrane protein
VSRNAARGALLGIAGQAWYLVTAFLLYKFLANELGSSPSASTALFGTWRVILSVLVWFEIFVNSGLVKMATKRLAEKPGDESRLERAAYLGQALVAVIVFALVELVAPLIAAGLGHPEWTVLVRVSAIDIPVYSLFLAASSIQLGRGGFDRQAIGWIVYATAKLVLIAGLVWMRLGVTGALVGNALASTVGFAIVVSRWGKTDAPLAELRVLAREMLIDSLPFLGLALLEGLAASTDLWVVSGVVRGTGSVSRDTLIGFYASAAVLVDMPTFLLLGVNRVLFPSVARSSAEGDESAVRTIATGGLRVALIITLLAASVIVASGRAALQVALSGASAGAYAVLAVLIFACVGRSAREVCTEVLLATNRSGISVVILAGSVALEIALLVALIPRWGVVGAAAGAAFAAVVSGVWAALSLRSALSWRALATLVRAVLAAAIVGAALSAIPLPNPYWVLVTYPLAAVAYLALLGVMREFDAEDLATARSALGL